MLRKTPLVLLFFGLLLHLGAAECNVNRPVLIRLINDAAVKPKVVIAAQQEAAYVLKSLCVEVEWASGPSTEALEMRIVMAPVGPGITEGCLGITLLNAPHGNRGAVFLSRVRALQEQNRLLIGLGALLGCVLAHEIGHLLVNSRAHSLGGVMIAKFGQNEIYRAAQRRLTFTRFDREMFSRSQIARRF